MSFRWFGLVVCLAAPIALADEAPSCPAEAQPGWSSLSAVEKREQVRLCMALGPSLAPAWKPKPEGPKTWSTFERVAVSSGVSAFLISGTFSLVGSLTGFGQFSVGGLALYASLSAVLAASTFWFVGSVYALTTANLAVTLGWAAGGAAVAVLCGAIVNAVAPMGQAFLATSFILGGLLPLVGALIGYQLTLKPAVQVTVAPAAGGAQLLFGMRW